MHCGILWNCVRDGIPRFVKGTFFTCAELSFYDGGGEIVVKSRPRSRSRSRQIHSHFLHLLSLSSVVLKHIVSEALVWERETGRETSCQR